MASRDLQSAAAYINSSLVTKGYLKEDQRIDFASLGDSKDDDRSLVTNDTRIINVIYGLLDAVDNDNSNSERQQSKITELEKRLEREAIEKRKISLQLQAAERRILSDSLKQQQLQSSMKMAEVNHINTKEELTRLSGLVSQLKTQFANELRRKDVEISKIKMRLSEPRHGKTHYGSKGTLTRLDSRSPAANAIESSPVREETVEKLSQTLVQLNDALVAENGLLLKELYKVNCEICKANGKPPALEEFVWKGPNLGAAGVARRTAHGNKISASIYSNLKQISDLLNDPNVVSVDEVRDRDKTIAHLTEKLRETTENWQKAIKTMDEWKKYRSSRASAASGNRPSPTKKETVKRF